MIQYDMAWHCMALYGIGIMLVMHNLPMVVAMKLLMIKTKMIMMIISKIKILGKPRCTGVWAWGENHGRAVELYRESIEATQVMVI